MNRREWIRNGALWTLGATVATPELIERLTWKRRLFPSADLRRRYLDAYRGGRWIGRYPLLSLRDGRASCHLPAELFTGELMTVVAPYEKGILVLPAGLALPAGVSVNLCLRGL